MSSDFKLCILTPTTGFVRMAYAASLYSLVQTLLTQNAKQSLCFYAIEGAGVSANRECLVDLAKDTTHILFIDEDMGFDPEALSLLVQRNLPIVGCNYRIKQDSGNFMAMGRDGRIATNETSTGIERVFYTGFGFCLIERNVFDKIERPWFLHNYKDGKYTTEESGFAAKIAKAGIPWHVDHDASKLVYHVGHKNYTYN